MRCPQRVFPGRRDGLARFSPNDHLGKVPRRCRPSVVADPMLDRGISPPAVISRTDSHCRSVAIAFYNGRSRIGHPTSTLALPARTPGSGEPTHFAFRIFDRHTVELIATH